MAGTRAAGEAAALPAPIGGSIPLGKVVTALSMSLDGVIAGPNDGPDLPIGDEGERLFDWCFNGDAELPFPMDDGELICKTSSASAKVLKSSFGMIGQRRLGDERSESPRAGEEDTRSMPRFLSCPIPVHQNS